MSEASELTWESGPEGMLARFSGRIDFDNAPEICQRGLDYLHQCSEQSLRVDLSDLEWSNSILFSILLRWLQASEERGIRMEITAITPHLSDLARLSGLESVLPLGPLG